MKKKAKKKTVKKTKAIVKKNDNKLVLKEDEKAIVAKIVTTGDISGLSAVEKAKYYNVFCRSLGLNPVTRPFQIIAFQGGKQQLYATKDATEQLRKLNGVSITSSQVEEKGDIYIVRVLGVDKTGRTDCATGAVTIAGLRGDALANAVMKAETKAKRRLTLSICGLGMLDQTEIETIPGARAVPEMTVTPPKPEMDPEEKKVVEQIKGLMKELQMTHDDVVEMMKEKGMKSWPDLDIDEKRGVANMLADKLVFQEEKRTAAN